MRQLNPLYSSARQRSASLAAVLWAVLVVLLAGCSTGVTVTSATATPTPTRRPVLFHEVPETFFAQPLPPLPEGPIMVRGIYGRYGSTDQGLDLCRLENSVLYCQRYPVVLDVQGPLLVEVRGQVEQGQLSVNTWQALQWDEAAARASVGAEMARRAEELYRYDWSLIARPDFAESSAWFHWQPERILATPVELFGYDMASDRVIWRAQGREMPQQKHLVHRFPVLYFLTDPQGQQPVEVYITIEGYVEE